MNVIYQRKYGKESEESRQMNPKYYDHIHTKEEHRLRVFENRVLRRIFGPKKDEETGKWRKLHNEELHKLVLLTKHN
jgi:hypothetical protein